MVAGRAGDAHSRAPGPRAPLRSSRRQAVQPVAQDTVQELTWDPLYTRQPPQSSLFSPDSIIPKNKKCALRHLEFLVSRPEDQAPVLYPTQGPCQEHFPPSQEQTAAEPRSLAM